MEQPDELYKYNLEKTAKCIVALRNYVFGPPVVVMQVETKETTTTHRQFDQLVPFSF